METACLNYPQVAALMEGVMKPMLLTKLKTVTTVLLLSAFVGTGVGIIIYPAAAGGETETVEKPEKSKGTAAKAAFTMRVDADRVFIEGSHFRAIADLASYDDRKGLLILEGKGENSVVLWRQLNATPEKITGKKIVYSPQHDRFKVLAGAKNLTEIPETEVVVRLGQLYRLQMSDKKPIKTITNGYSQLVGVTADDDSSDGSSVVLTPYHISTAHFALTSSDGTKEYFRVIVTKAIAEPEKQEPK